MSELRLSVPMPPVATNRRSGNGWRKVHREKKSYAKQLDELQAAGLIPPPPVVPWPRTVIRSVMHLGSAMDDDNAMARHKPLIDWLKTRGYIADDRRKNLAWHSLPDQIVKRKDVAYHIELTLRAL